MGNIADEQDYYSSRRQHYRWALEDMIAAQRFTHVLGLAWNADTGFPSSRRSVSLDSGRRDIGALLARIDRRLLGTRFHRASIRTRAVFFVEHPDRNFHVHGFLRPPIQAPRLMEFHRLFPYQRGGIWNEIVPAGSYELGILGDERERTIGYCLKEQHLQSDDRTIIWASEFHR